MKLSSNNKPRLVPLTIFLIVLIAGSLWVLLSKKLQPQVTPPSIKTQRQFDSITEVPMCDDSSSAALAPLAGSWKSYLDNYSGFSMSIPTEFSLFKGPADATDDEYQKAIFTSKYLKYQLTSNIGERQYNIYLDFKNQCKSIEDCMANYIKKDNGDTRIICMQQFNNRTYIKSQYIRTSVESSIVSTYWTIFLSSKNRIVDVTFGEMGPDTHPFRDFYSKVIDSFKFKE